MHKLDNATTTLLLFGSIFALAGIITWIASELHQLLDDRKAANGEKDSHASETETP